MRRWVEAGRGCRKRLSSDEGGFTLVEVMAAITILVVAVLAIAGVAAQSMRSTRLARDRQLATAAATAAMEEARAISYADLAVEATCAQAVAEGDYVSGTCPGTPTLSSTGEELVLTTSSLGIDLEVVEGRFSVRTFVSWYDDATASGTRDAKRVTVSVTWDEVGGPARELAQSTIISESDRGLPVPEFVIRPTSQHEVVETGDPICLSQTLTNIGAADTYDFLGSKGGSGTASGNHFKMGNWLVYGWLGPSGEVPTVPLEAWEDSDSDGQVDVDGSGNPIPNDTYTDGGFNTLMKDHTSDLIPDSDPNSRVPRSASRTFVTCYFPKSGSEADPTFTISVRSGFDSGVSVDLVHTLDTTDLILNLYLRDPQSVDPDVDVVGSDPCLASDWLPSGTGRDETFLLEDGSPPTCSSLRNYDTDHDAQPGLLLPRSTTPPSAKFDYQFQTASTIGGSGTLRLWTSHPNAVTSPDTTSARTIAFDVTLKRVNTADASRNATFHTTQVSYTHPAGAQWQPHTLDLTGIPNTTFQSTEFLRLEISCPNASQRDCVIAYDVTSAGTPPADANLVVSSP